MRKRVLYGFVLPALLTAAPALWCEEAATEAEASPWSATAGLSYVATSGNTGYPNFDDSGNWRGSSETAIQASLSSRLALKLAYLLRYRNEPVEGFDDTDTTTIASLVLQF